MRGARRLLVLAMVLAGSGCGDGLLSDCDRTMGAELISPDAAHKAAVLDVACGTTTRDAYWVLLTRADREFSGRRDRVAVFEGRPERVEWRGTVLHVDHGSAKPFLMNEEAGGVRIVYAASAPVP
ncbi:MAG TPA: hypothetical protein VN153_10860 [Tahibacter sp.]|nr:hypothetical protein [Tahibacter sp.]